MTIRTYMGQEIRRTAWVDSARWYLPAKHHTGVPMDERECRQFSTLREAREAIREEAKDALMLRIMSQTAERLESTMVAEVRTGARAWICRERGGFVAEGEGA